MTIKALAFDVNGTLIDILTDESMDEIYRALRHFLTYQGIDLSRNELRDLYFARMKEQMRASTEPFPEYDTVDIWRTILQDRRTDYTRNLAEAKLQEMPGMLAQMFRGISRKRLQLYPSVLEVLGKLRTRFPMAIVTDAQSAYAMGELNQVGLTPYFQSIIVSGDYGYRKPDPRLFQKALDAMGVAAAETLFIGNDMYRDIHGAQQAGMQTLMFNSPQGDKSYAYTTPDFTITDYRDLLPILGLTGE
jgi:putative hydrolase of the HAD superfamily